MRYTEARRRLVGVIGSAARPLTLAEILASLHEDGPIPQSSVYRNLADLEAAGVATRVQGADEFGRFELSEDLSGHHHHLLCEGCGTVADVHLSAELERTLDSALAQAAAASGFEVSGHRVDIVGRCGACTAKAAHD